MEKWPAGSIFGQVKSAVAVCTPNNFLQEVEK